MLVMWASESAPSGRPRSSLSECAQLLGGELTDALHHRCTLAARIYRASEARLVAHVAATRSAWYHGCFQTAAVDDTVRHTRHTASLMLIHDGDCFAAWSTADGVTAQLCRSHTWLQL
mmetsp:Transcript_62720/g.139650  ORF Transcript_62720/g.139650 Transcript_62720/m.139650 type:complete len:118 (-) Transcript_62720:149-502(-)